MQIIHAYSEMQVRVKFRGEVNLQLTIFNPQLGVGRGVSQQNGFGTCFIWHQEMGKEIVIALS